MCCCRGGLNVGYVVADCQSMQCYSGGHYAVMAVSGVLLLSLSALYPQSGGHPRQLSRGCLWADAAALPARLLMAWSTMVLHAASPLAASAISTLTNAAVIVMASACISTRWEIIAGCTSHRAATVRC